MIKHLSDKTTDELEKYLELPLINDEREATRPEVARQADEKKREGLGAEKSDIPAALNPHFMLVNYTGAAVDLSGEIPRKIGPQGREICPLDHR